MDIEEIEKGLRDLNLVFNFYDDNLTKCNYHFRETSSFLKAKLSETDYKSYCELLTKALDILNLGFIAKTTYLFEQWKELTFAYRDLEHRATCSNFHNLDADKSFVELFNKYSSMSPEDRERDRQEMFEEVRLIAADLYGFTK